MSAAQLPAIRCGVVSIQFYKVRIKNSDVPKGKSGGYRVICYIKTADRIVLIAIYAKTEQADLAPKIIRQMIEDYKESLKD